MSRAIVIVAFALLMGCYRTHYANFSTQNPERSTESHVPVRVTGWQHFFVYGWAPGERRIDAREQCGGVERIHSIQTRQTFVEGLIAAFAGYYINIYSPWNGAVYCTEEPPPK